MVDNGSGDGAVSSLPAWEDAPGRRRRLRRLRMPANLGFAAAANAGLQAASGEYLFLLNPDTEAEPSCVSELVGANADVAAARLLLMDDPDRLDNCGSALYPDGLNWCRGRGELASGRYEQEDEVLVFSGAAVLFRREVLLRTGLFDPDYFAYGEDADLSLRVAREGMHCRYVPSARVLHRVGGSFGRLGLRKVFLVERNRARVAVTHLPWSWLLASPLWTLARHGVMARGAASGTGLPSAWSPSRRFLLPAVVLAAHAASLVELPGSLRRRRALRGRLDPARLAAARVGPSELAARPPGGPS